MKHAANRSRSTAKSKTLTQVKGVKKTKPTAKKPIVEVALNSRRKSTVQKAKPVAAKIVAPKVSAKTLNALKTVSNRKIKPLAKQSEKPKAKKAASKISARAVQTSAPKTKRISSTKKVTTVEKKIKNTKTAPKAKSETMTAKPKVSAKASGKTSVRTTKAQPSKVAVWAAKSRRLKVETAATTAKIKSSRRKAKPVIAAKKLKNIGRSRPIVSAKPAKRKKIAPTVPAKKVSRQSKKTQPIVSAKKIIKKTAQAKPIIPIKKVGKMVRKMKPAVSAATVNKRNPKIKKTASVGKIKPVEKVIEATTPRAPKPKNRKARPISSAVFRGKKERYDFKVFALNEKFEPIPAVYIISKRKTDRHKRGHHALICIGETASISDELKRHRRGKCVKKHEANVVSILPEVDEKIRLKIETDLKAAHTVACNLD